MYFEVKGKIRGKERPRFFRGHAVTPKQTKEYEELIRSSYLALHSVCLTSPVRVLIKAMYKIPKSYSKKRVEAIRRGEELPVKKPDADNIVKVVLDALNKVAFTDDKNVVEVSILKRYTECEEKLEIDIDKY